jgi:hypothetical protein
VVNIPFFSCSGEFVVVNKHLLHDLTEMGVWTPVLKKPDNKWRWFCPKDKRNPG